MLTVWLYGSQVRGLTLFARVYHTPEHGYGKQIKKYLLYLSVKSVRKRGVEGGRGKAFPPDTTNVV